jgi:hypothetical protein
MPLLHVHQFTDRVHRCPLLCERLGASIVHRFRRHQADARMPMHVVVPVEELLTVLNADRSGTCLTVDYLPASLPVRGRDDSCEPPPARFRARGATAHGSYLG